MRRRTEAQGTWRCPRLFPATRNKTLLVLKEEEKEKVSGHKCRRAASSRRAWSSSFFVNWWCVCVNILINRENRSPIYVIWGPPPHTLLGRGERKDVLESNLFCWCWGLMTIAKDK